MFSCMEVKLIEGVLWVCIILCERRRFEERWGLSGLGVVVCKCVVGNSEEQDLEEEHNCYVDGGAGWP